MDASPQSMIRTEDRSSTFPGQQTLLECRSSMLQAVWQHRRCGHLGAPAVVGREQALES